MIEKILIITPISISTKRGFDMCDAGLTLMTAASIASTAVAARQQRMSADLQEKQMLKQAEENNRVVTENYMANLTDLSLNQMEIEKEKNRMLDINTLAGIEATAEASLQGISSGVTGNSMAMLMRDIEGSYGNEEALILSQNEAQQRALERQKEASYRAAKNSTVNPTINSGGWKTNAGLKIAGAGLQGLGNYYSSKASLGTTGSTTTKT